MRTPRPCVLPRQPATRAVLLASGLTPQMIRTQLASGRLMRVRRGVFLDAERWPEEPAARHLVVARAELVVHPVAVMRHQSAAIVWGLPHPGFASWTDEPPAVTLPADGRVKSASGAAVRHHVARLPLGQVTHDEEGYPVTTPARTAVDLAAGRPLPEALVLLDAAARQACAAMTVQVRRSDYANARLREAACELLRTAATSRRPAGLLPTISLADPARESAAESLSAGHFHLAGIPMPRFQYPVRTPLGTFYPDCLWPEQGLVGECDGAVKYADASAYVREKEREQALRDQGWRVVRWLAREIMLRPGVVVERVARALGA